MKMTGTSDHYRGSCLCGAVSYEFEGDPLMVAVCHCSHCQKQSGGAFSVVAVIPDQAYVQHGETSTYRDAGDSGHAVYRHFCGTCGSPIISKADAFAGLTIIKAGTLDQRHQLVPTQEAYCGSALPWVGAVPGATRFDASNI